MTQLFDFIWNIINSIIEPIKVIITFIYDVFNLVSKAINYLPSPISSIILSVITVLIAITIFKFVK